MLSLEFLLNDRENNISKDEDRPWPSTAQGPPPLTPRLSGGGVRHGTPVVPGVAVGPVIRPQPRVDTSHLADLPVQDAETEAARYAAAVEVVAGRLAARAELASGVAAEVLVAQVGLVSDRGLSKAARKQITAGKGAEVAVCMAVDSFAAMFEQVGGLMAERVTDLRDLGGRLVAELQGLPEPGIAVPDLPSILLADDLAPADTAQLDPAKFVALAMSLGGPTSHTAIIARQLAIPCVVAADVDDIAVGTVILVDGSTGEIVIEPDREVAAEQVAADRRTRLDAESWTGPGSDLRRHPGLGLCERPGRRHRAQGGRRAERGRRTVPQRARVPRPGRRAHRRGAGGDLRRGARGVSASGRSSSAPWTPGRTSR